MKIPIYQVDAFASQLFEGNPAAVCPLEEWLPKGLMQKIAMENNLSETAFFVEDDGRYHLRWFTPTTEVDLCGHATLASAHVLFEHLGFGKDIIHFDCKSGKLEVRKDGDRLAMDFPAANLNRTTIPEVLEKALGVPPEEVYKNTDYLYVVETEAQVRNLKPDLRLLGEVETRGVIVTAPGIEFDFISRFFAPAAGVDEDPVTGSAHTMLTPYWSRKLGKKEVTGRQISGRGGTVFCEDRGSRVVLSGEARTFLKGQIQL